MLAEKNAANILTISIAKCAQQLVKNVLKSAEVWLPNTLKLNFKPNIFEMKILGLFYFLSFKASNNFFFIQICLGKSIFLKI